MWATGRVERVLFRIATAVFLLACSAGVVQSVRTERRLPPIDLLVSGAKSHIAELLNRGNSREAIRELELQTRLLPYDAAACEHLGNLLGSQSQFTAARRQFQKLVDRKSVV